MKRFVLICCCLQSLIGSFAQPCNNETIMSTKGGWKKRADASPFPDESFPKNQFSQANNRIDKMQKLLQAAYPNPKGMEAGWYRSITGDALIKGGPAPYELESLFFPYYCNSDKIELMPETGTWFYIWANQFNWFASFVKEFSVKKQPVFLLTRRSGEIGGYPAYEGINNGSSNTGTTYSRAVIITRQNQSPFTAVTRKQYLKAFILYNEKKLPESIAGIESGYKVTNNAEKQKKEEWIAQTKKGYEEAIRTVKDLLADSANQNLGQPAIVDAVDFSKFRGFSTE